MADQDWETRVLRKNIVKKKPKTVDKTIVKIDSNDQTTFKHKEITHSFKISLMRARQAKKLSQKELAQKINVKSNLINEYESGKTIPDGQIINKLNRALDIKLPKIKPI